MFCPNCGDNLADEAKFCPNCGKQISDEQLATPQQPASASATNFPELKKMQVGYIIFAATFIAAAILCLCMESILSALLWSIVVLIVGVAVGCYLIISSAKAGNSLPEQQNQALIALAKKWTRPLQIIPLIWIVALLISWLT